MGTSRTLMHTSWAIDFSPRFSKALLMALCPQNKSTTEYTLFLVSGNTWAEMVPKWLFKPRIT